VADAAEQCGADGAAAARAHGHEVVVARFDLAQERDADGLVGHDGGDREVLGHPVAGAAQDGLCLGVGVGDHGVDGRREVDGRRDLRGGGHQRQASVLALGEVDRLREGLVGVR
jgi:hypothetical protein